MLKINVDRIGIANGKALLVKNLCITAGFTLLTIGLYADELCTDWMPVDELKERLKEHLSENK